MRAYDSSTTCVLHRFTAATTVDVDALAGLPIWSNTNTTAMNATSAFFILLTGADRDAYNPPGRLWGCSSAGRALASHVRGRGFESPHLHQGRQILYVMRHLNRRSYAMELPVACALTAVDVRDLAG